MRRNKTSAAPRWGLLRIAAEKGNTLAARQSALALLRWHAHFRPRIEPLLGQELTSQIAAEAEQAAAIEQKIAELEARAGSNLGLLLDGLDEILRNDPSNLKARTLFFRTCEKLKDAERAFATARRFAPDGDSPTLMYDLARVLVAAGRHDEAIANLVSAIAAAPRQGGPVDLIVKLARLFPSTLAALEREIEQKRGSAAEPAALDAMLQAAVAASSEPKGASMTVLGEVSSVSPGQIEALYSTARSLDVQGDSVAAVRAYVRWADAAKTHDAYLEAARAAERLHEVRRAEYLYNNVIHYDRNSAEARDGLQRVLQAKGQAVGRSSDAEPGARELADRKLKQGSLEDALPYYVQWAKQQDSAASWLYVAELCEQRGTPALAVPLYQRALLKEPENARAAQALERLTPGQQSLPALSDVVNSIKVGTPEAALKLADQIVTRTSEPAVLVTLAALLRKPGLGASEDWISDRGRNGTAMRWLLGFTTFDGAAAHVRPEELRVMAAHLAVIEKRWTDVESELALAGNELPLEARLYLALARHRLGRTSDSIKAFNGSTDFAAAAIAECRPSELQELSGVTEPAIRDLLASAWSAYKEGGLRDAMSWYQLAGQGNSPGASDARMYEALIRMQLDDLEEAERLLRGLRHDQYKRNDPVCLWNHAVCSLRLGHSLDALNTLKVLVQTDPLHKAARKVAGAIELSRGNAAEAFRVLHPLTEIRPDSAELVLLLSAAQAAGERETVTRIFDELELMAEGREDVSLRRSLSEELAELDPKRNRNGQDLERLCFGLLREGRVVLASAFIAAYLRVHPNHMPAAFLRARLKARAGAVDEAIETLEALASKLAPEQASVPYKWVAECHLLAGRPREALEILKKRVLPHRPNDDEVSRFLREAEAKAPAPLPMTRRDAAVASLPPRLDALKIESVARQLREERTPADAAAYLRAEIGRRRVATLRVLYAQLLIESDEVGEALRELDQIWQNPAPKAQEFRMRNLTAVLRTLISTGRVGIAIGVIGKKYDQATPAERSHFSALAEEIASAALTPTVRVQYAELFLQLNDTSRARTELRRARAEAPRDKTITARVRELAPDLLKKPETREIRQTWAKYKKQGPGGALQGLDFIRITLAEWPDEPDFLRLEAEALHEAGRDDEALEASQRLIALLVEHLAQTNVSSERKSLVQQLRKERLFAASLCAARNDEEGEAALYADLLDENPFDVNAHEGMRRLGRASVLECNVSDPALLAECERVFQSGRPSDHVRLGDRLRTLKNWEELAAIVRTFIAHAH
ncbi:MAG TPA: tetratricopeptide repeat protein, partial [Thermoanaerobaculia bacterium]|nr:tetratricopeptide repeat protein [Thermoanaerobaculia bacterium]